MRLPRSAHTSRPWRIHEITRDFRLDSVWATPTPGGPDDFPRLVELVASWDPSRSPSPAVRALSAIRLRAGGMFGLDRPDPRVPTLRERLPEDLRAAPCGPRLDVAPSVPLYLLEDEWAVEIPIKAIQGVLHLGWVPDETGGYRGQMATLVKRHGLLGSAYMAAIAPVGQPIFYPRVMRQIERDWRI
jgi:hypothetical protein